MTTKATKDIDAIFADGRLIDLAVRRAARQAVRDHERLDLPMVAWRDGKVVWVKPWLSRRRRGTHKTRRKRS